MKLDMQNVLGILIVLVFIFIGYSYFSNMSMTGMSVAVIDANVTKNETVKPVNVLLETNMGNITIEMRTDMPITTGNFVKLVKQGFYDGVIFHRVMDNFMIQGGDPQGTGTGGPGYVIKDEFVNGSTNLRGTIAMANSGPNSGGSQFFINLVDNTYLDWDKPPFTSKHPVFGKVVSGMDVVDAIGKVKVNGNSKPLQNVTIIRATVV